MEALDMAADAGFEAIRAANADDAIRILESRDDIRVIFTDINMPGSMDGLKLAHAVRGRWPPIKIIVTSALVDDRPRPAESLFFLKPYDVAEVAKAIQDLAA
jgi:CheY-like chemotaxis protein